MQYYIYNGGPQGPFTREKLTELNITEDTPVWYEGLDDWMPAAVAPETAFLFRSVSVEDLAPRPIQQETRDQERKAPALRTMTQAEGQEHKEDSHNQFLNQPQYQQQPGYYQGQPQFTPQPITTIQAPAKRPKSYLTASIIVAILFFTITGIVAIIYAARTRSALKYGDFVDAKKFSEHSQLWIIISIVIGLIVGYFQFMYLIGTGFGGAF